MTVCAEIELEESNRHKRRQAQADEDFARFYQDNHLCRLYCLSIYYDRRLAYEDTPSSGVNSSALVLKPGEKVTRIIRRNINLSSHSNPYYHVFQTAVRLFNPKTRNSVGEALYVHYTNDNLMLFELVQNPQSYLSIQPNGSICESILQRLHVHYYSYGSLFMTVFQRNLISASKFHIEIIHDGIMYLKTSVVSFWR